MATSALEMAERVTSEARQIPGGAGYTTLHPIERSWRDAKLTKIFEGASEIQQRIISDQTGDRGATVSPLNGATSISDARSRAWAMS